MGGGKLNKDKKQSAAWNKINGGLKEWLSITAVWQ